MPSTHHRALTALAALALTAPAGLAAPGGPTAKLWPNDPMWYQDFGTSVAVDGTTAVIGAIGDSTNGSVAGAAYVFDVSTGQQVHKLLPGDGSAIDNFGISVAVHGTRAIIGAHKDDDNGNSSGSAYIFDTVTGQELHKLLPSDGAAEDEFGNAVAIHGNLALVGAWESDHSGRDSGAAYFFDVTTGQEIQKWIPGDGAADDGFGLSVAIGPWYAMAGAYYKDEVGVGSGTAYVYDLNLGQTLGKLLPNDAFANDQFGYAVALSGSTGLVTAVGNDDNGNASGSGYFFDLTSGQQLHKLLASDGSASDKLGVSAAFWGTTAVLGAYTSEGGTASGSAYLFDSVTGQQIDKLLSSDSASGDWAGGSVSISGTTVLVGARKDDDNGTGSGTVFQYGTCPEDLLLAATPNVANQGDLLNLTTYGGLPGQPNILSVIDVNGISTYQQITWGLFSASTSSRPPCRVDWRDST